jgi:hypothetical protein
MTEIVVHDRVDFESIRLRINVGVEEEENPHGGVVLVEDDGL